MPLPDVVVERARRGTVLAPTLREVVETDGIRYAVLDVLVEVPAAPLAPFADLQCVLGFDWGVRVLVIASVVDLDGQQLGRPFFVDTGPLDGRQARLRRQIDQLNAKVARLEAQRDRFPVGDSKRTPAEDALPRLRQEIGRCWRKYQARNHDLAHLAANILLVLATAFDCQLIAGESLKSLRSAGRGRGVKGRWRNWRTNAQIRGELWRVVRYKCLLAGVRLEWQQPRDTSHVCPRCGKPANTCSSPEQRGQIDDWGAWLCCSNPECLWNGSRDYAASLNIARLGAALVRQAQTTGRVVHPLITDPSVQPVSYRGTWAALRLPPLVLRDHLKASGRIYCNGWRVSVKLRSSYATPIMLRLCG
jgi:transposase